MGRCPFTHPSPIFSEKLAYPFDHQLTALNPSLQMLELQGEVEDVGTERDQALERVSLIEEGIAQLQNG